MLRTDPRQCDSVTVFSVDLAAGEGVKAGEGAEERLTTGDQQLSVNQQDGGYRINNTTHGAGGR